MLVGSRPLSSMKEKKRHHMRTGRERPLSPRHLTFSAALSPLARSSLPVPASELRHSSSLAWLQANAELRRSLLQSTLEFRKLFMPDSTEVP